MSPNGRRAPALAGILAIALVALVAGPAVAAQPAVGTTQLVSVDITGTTGGDNSVSNGEISDDGRYVVYSTASQNNVLLDTNGSNYDVLRTDLVTGTTIMVNMSTLGFQGDAGSGGARISADGRYVVFDSTSTNLDPLDTNARSDVFLRDLVTFTTTLVSINTAGTAGGDGDSYNPAISADGSTVTFTSTSTDVSVGDVNGVDDVFYRNVLAGAPTTQLVSLSTALVAGDDDSGRGAASVSADGRYVAFVSLASTFAPGAVVGYQVFLRDITGGSTTLVSADTGGAVGNGSSENPSISDDGSLVAFNSAATNLVAGDTNGVSDIFLRTVAASTTALVSLPRASGGGTPAASESPGLSADGKVVAWYSKADNFVDAPVTGNGDAYARTLAAGFNQLLSVNLAGTGGGSDRSYGPTLSSDGAYTAFASNAADLDPLKTSGFTDMFARALIAPPAAPAKAALAATGSRDSSGTAWVALALIALGALLVATRRRRGAHAA